MEDNSEKPQPGPEEIIRRMGGGAPEYMQHTPDKRVDPWGYFGRFLGLLLIIMGLFWLTRFMDIRFKLAKIALVSAGILWGQAVKIAISNRDKELQYRETGGLWFFRIAAILCLMGGLQAVPVIDPLVAGSVIYFLSGGLALFIGGMILNRKIWLDKDLQNEDEEDCEEGKKEESL